MSGRKLSSGGIEDILNSEPIEELVRPTELFIAKYSFKKNNHYVTKLKSTRL